MSNFPENCTSNQLDKYASFHPIEGKVYIQHFTVRKLFGNNLFISFDGRIILLFCLGKQLFCLGKQIPPRSHFRSLSRIPNFELCAQNSIYDSFRILVRRIIHLNWNDKEFKKRVLRMIFKEFSLQFGSKCWVLRMSFEKDFEGKLILFAGWLKLVPVSSERKV